MKLSEHTTSILKNYATINQNLVIKEGKDETEKLATIERQTVHTAKTPEGTPIQVFPRPRHIVAGVLIVCPAVVRPRNAVIHYRSATQTHISKVKYLSSCH